MNKTSRRVYGYVSAWARPFVGAEDADGPAPRNVTPGYRWGRRRGPEPGLREAAEAWHRQKREDAGRYGRLALFCALAAAVLFGLSQTPPLPHWVHWTAFFGSVVLGAAALISAEEAWCSSAGANLGADLSAADDE